MAAREVKISKVAGRYLVFDIEDIMFIRRNHNMCAVLTGTMPQNPTQNVFLSVPIELYPEEAQILLEKKAAYIADDPAEHLAQLANMHDRARKAYIQSLMTQRRNAQQYLDDEKAQANALHKDKRAKAAKARKKLAANSESTNSVDGDSLFGPGLTSPAYILKKRGPEAPAVTPTTSAHLVPKTNGTTVEVPKSYPLYAHLNSNGFYITPGLRFGGDYSVYPGDPFRYHAHFMANSYEWDEEIPMLDLITSGRLGTAVKKSFLMGGRKPVERGESVEGKEFRAFCIEWAGM